MERDREGGKAMTKGTKWMVVIFAVFVAFALGMLFQAQTQQRPVSADPDTNIFPVDGNVGIGTISPAEKLHVVGNTRISHPDAPRMFLERTATSPILWNFEAGSTVPGNGFAIADLTNLTQKFVIESGVAGNVLLPSGKVGIGTTSPTDKLHVVGNTRISHPDAPRLFLQRTATSPILWNFEAGSTVPGNGFAIADLTNLTQKFVIESGVAGNVLLPSGNVGIGTTSPTDKLQVVGNTRISHPDAPRLLLQRTATSPILWNFEAGQTVQGNGFAIADLTNLTQKFVIESGAAGNVILPSGKVGIGTTSPAEKLEVVGNIKLSGTNPKITAVGEICIGSGC
jgi:hypothetical protein